VANAARSVHTATASFNPAYVRSPIRDAQPARQRPLTLQIQLMVCAALAKRYANDRRQAAPALGAKIRHYVATSTTSIFVVENMSSTIMVYSIPGALVNGRIACHQCIKQQAGGTGWNSDPT